MVKCFNCRFPVRFYSEASVIPKMHYMVHIPRLMIKLDIDIVFAYIY